MLSRVINRVRDRSSNRSNRGKLLCNGSTIKRRSIGRSLRWNASDVRVLTGGNIELLGIRSIGRTAGNDGTV